MDISQPFEVGPPRGARGRVTAPASKSHAIRCLVCAALADGVSTLRGLSACDAEDVVRTARALRALGFPVEEERVVGLGGVIVRPHASLDLGGSATALRFLAAVVSLANGPTTLTGDASLRRRSMDATVRSVRGLGATVRAAFTGDAMTPPLVIERSRPLADEVEVDAAGSSHPLSALLLVGPALPRGITVHVPGRIASRPYVDLTLWTMRAFGVRAEDLGSAFQVRPGGYEPADVEIVGDWSSAAFAMAAGALDGGDVEVLGLETRSPQADRRIVDLLREFGARVDFTPDGVRVRAGGVRALDVDLHDAPDLAPLVGALGCVATGTTRVRGAAHLRQKESDRIAAVVDAATALGCAARASEDGFEVTGPASHGGKIVTRGDHRIAMAFAVAGLAVGDVVVDDAACVAKSYPGFWSALTALAG